MLVAGRCSEAARHSHTLALSVVNWLQKAAATAAHSLPLLQAQAAAAVATSGATPGAFGSSSGGKKKKGGGGGKGKKGGKKR